MTQVTERRHCARQRALKGGKIFYNDFCVSYDCIIRNESDGGMQIKVTSEALIPREFAILNRKDGTLANARMIWQKGTQIGIELTSAREDVRQSPRSDIRQLLNISTPV